MTFGVTCILDCSVFINGMHAFMLMFAGSSKPFTTMGSDAGSYNGDPIFVFVRSQYIEHLSK